MLFLYYQYSPKYVSFLYYSNPPSGRAGNFFFFCIYLHWLARIIYPFADFLHHLLRGFQTSKFGGFVVFSSPALTFYLILKRVQYQTGKFDSSLFIVRPIKIHSGLHKEYYIINLLKWKIEGSKINEIQVKFLNLIFLTFVLHEYIFHTKSFSSHSAEYF